VRGDVHSGRAPLVLRGYARLVLRGGRDSLFAIFTAKIIRTSAWPSPRESRDVTDDRHSRTERDK
jgi:hypothetical protein